MSSALAIVAISESVPSELAPGRFVDLDEARIPLWTVRATYQLFQNWGPFSSTFLDTYPSNSFIWVTSFVWTWYPDETKYKDYRATGLLKPSALERQGALFRSIA